MMFGITFLSNFLPLVPRALAVEITPCIPGASIRCESDIAGYIESALLGGGSGPLFAAFGGVFFGSMIYYGFRLAAESRSSEGISSATLAMAQALFGAALVSGAYVITSSFVTNEIVDASTLEAGFIAQGVGFVVKSIGFVLLLNIVVQAFRLIMSTSDGGIDSARSNLIQSFAGAIMVMLAKPMLSLVLPGAFNSSLNGQIVGIANFIATIFGVLSVLTLIVAGIMLIVSVNESLKDRARTLILTSLVAIIVIIVSIALITILLPV